MRLSVFGADFCLKAVQSWMLEWSFKQGSGVRGIGARHERAQCRGLGISAHSQIGWLYPWVRWFCRTAGHLFC